MLASPPERRSLMRARSIAGRGQPALLTGLTDLQYCST
jgi:hypothetical protein